LNHHAQVAGFAGSPVPDREQDFLPRLELFPDPLFPTSISNRDQVDSSMAPEKRDGMGKKG
jgi:hypothetical protein